jgi:hypothetical protein
MLTKTSKQVLVVKVHNHLGNCSPLKVVDKIKNYESQYFQCCVHFLSNKSTFFIEGEIELLGKNGVNRVNCFH